MGEIIDARHRFAPVAEGEFVSGEKAEPGVYLNVEGSRLLILKEADHLPEDVRVVRSYCRYRRFESKEEAYEYLAEQETLRRAA